MKVHDFVKVQTRPTRKTIVLNIIDMGIQSLVFFAFLVLCIGVLALI